MTSEIASLLQDGWKNLWKNRIIWLFGFVGLIDPLLSLYDPFPEITDLTSASINLAAGLVVFYLLLLGSVGVSFIAYGSAIEKQVNLETAFRASQNLWWRCLAVSVLLLVFVAPVIGILAFSLWQFFAIRDVDRVLVLAVVPLSMFTAVWYFAIAETIANNTKVIQSLTSAWTVFTRNFAPLATMGLLLIIGLRVMILIISMAVIFIQNKFDVAAINQLDFLVPRSSFSNDQFYNLMAAVPQAIWQTYAASIFTVAYLKNRGAKMSKYIRF